MRHYLKKEREVKDHQDIRYLCEEAIFKQVLQVPGAMLVGIEPPTQDLAKCLTHKFIKYTTTTVAAYECGCFKPL